MAEDGIFDVMAQKLLEDYASLFYVNAATDEYIWYAKDPAAKKFVNSAESTGFYEYVTNNAVQMIHEEDRGLVADYLRYDNLIKSVEPGQTKDIKFRYMAEGTPEYYTMRVIRLDDNEKGEPVFIIGLENINDEERRNRVVQKIKEEREVYNQIAVELKNKSPYSFTMMTTVTDGHNSGRGGYIPDDESYGAQVFEVLGSGYKQGYAQKRIVDGLLDLIHNATH